jgi:hypothetical protein
MQGKHAVTNYFVKFQCQWKVWYCIFSNYFSVSGVCKDFLFLLFVRHINAHATLEKKDGRPQIDEKHVLHFFQPLGEIVISKFELQITNIYFRKYEQFQNFRQVFGNKNIILNAVLQ